MSHFSVKESCFSWQSVLGTLFLCHTELKLKFTYTSNICLRIKTREERVALRRVGVQKENRRSDISSLTFSDLQVVEGFSLKYLRIKINGLSFYPGFQLSGLLNKIELTKYVIVLQI